MSSETPFPSPDRDSTLYLRDMLQFCERVIEYSSVADLAALLGEPMRYDATLRNLELIGEAATRVPPALRERAPEIPWRLVIGTRNRLAHAYLGIEAETVWSITKTHVPRLQAQLQALLATLSPSTD